MFPQWTASKLEHLVFGRCFHRSFAAPVPLIFRTERKTTPHPLPLVWVHTHYMFSLCVILAPPGFITSPCGHLCWRWDTFCLKLSSTKLHLWPSGSWHRSLWQVSVDDYWGVMGNVFTILTASSCVFLGVSVIAMLIGFQCFPESQEEVGARQKKRNWEPASTVTTSLLFYASKNIRESWCSFCFMPRRTSERVDLNNFLL